jgi:hypothetical protein
MNQNKSAKSKSIHTTLLAISLTIALMIAPSFAHASGGHWATDNYYYDYIGGQWQRTAYWEPIGNGNGYLWQVVNKWDRTMLYWNGRWYWVNPLAQYMANCGPFGCF